MKTLFAASALSLALATSAFAQTAPVTQAQPLIEIENNVTVEPFGLSVDELEGRDLVDGNGVVLGEIENVVGIVSTTPSALVVDLAESDATVVVPLERFSLRDGTVVVEATLGELSALPAYNN